MLLRHGSGKRCRAVRSSSVWREQVLAAGSGIALAVLYVLTDILAWRWTLTLLQPFGWLGANSIAVYFGDEFLEMALPWIYWKDPDKYSFGPLAWNAFQSVLGRTYITQLAFAGSIVLFWVVISCFLYHLRIFFKV